MLHLAIVVTSVPDQRLLLPFDTRGAWDLMPGRWRVDQRWLGEGEAWEAQVLVPDADAGREALSIVRERLAGRRVDINVVPASRFRRKRLLVADMESTIVEQEFIDELADLAGERLAVAAITERAMRGEMDFEAALIQRVARLKGLSIDDLEQVYRTRLDLMPGAAELVATMRRDGATTALVTSGFSYFARRIAARLGFDTYESNRTSVLGGRLDGSVMPPVVGPAEKRAALERLAAVHGLAPAETLAVGDGANDIEMIRAAGLGVAFRAKPVLREATAALPTGAVVTHGGLSALLYLQGYRREEFARP